MVGGVLQASSDSKVQMLPYKEDDSQFWFWENNNIYSKKYPTKVLSLDFENHRSWGQVFLKSNRGDNKQKWNFENEALISQYRSLSLDIKYESGEPEVGASPHTNSLHQKWSLSLYRFYFLITSRQTGKVLDTSLKSPGRVHMMSYHGGDNQLWFWDDDNIRSKKFPDKVLEIDMNEYKTNTFGKVYLNSFHGGNNQRWKWEGDDLSSKYKQLRLDIKGRDTADEATVGGYTNTGSPNQQWSFGTIRAFFFILNKKSGRVLEATSKSVIEQWRYNGGDHQQWFWDGDVIRNKKYIDRVIDLDVTYGGEDAKLDLNVYHGRLIQRWEYTDKYLVSRYQNLSIKVAGDSMANGAAICAQTSKTNKWSLTPAHDFFTITSRHDTKVLEAGPRETLKGRNVLISSYNESDSQLWFWDDKNIRSKKFPDTVLELNHIDHEIDGIYWVKVFLNSFNDDKAQRWKFNRGKFFSASH